MTIDASLLRQAAASATGHQHLPTGALYVVATPIGNLADLTLRAAHVLAIADALGCEDTRVTAGLLRNLGLEGKPLMAVHQHNEQAAADGVLRRLAAGERVALVSDAGTPAVSDPGARLVAAVVAAGHVVVPIPGASAALAALSVAGDARAEGFGFVGFLPAKGAERRARLATVVQDTGAQVLFEAPHRVATLAQELAQTAPGRTLTVCRELTKQFETIHTGPAQAWSDRLAADAQQSRGEFVVVLHALAPLAAAPTDDPALSESAERLLALLLQHLPLKQAAALTAEHEGLPRKRVYARALALRQDATGDEHADDDGQTPAGDEAPR